MSALTGAHRVSPRAGLLGLAAIVVASALGLPIGSWAAAFAVVLLGVAGLAMIVGLKDAAKGFAAPILWSLAVSVGATGLRVVALRVVLDPRVRIGAVLTALALVMAAVITLAGKVAAVWPGSAHPARPTFRARADVREPETPLGPARLPARPDARDDLGLFGEEEHE